MRFCELKENDHFTFPDTSKAHAHNGVWAVLDPCEGGLKSTSGTAYRVDKPRRWNEHPTIDVWWETEITMYEFVQTELEGE